MARVRVVVELEVDLSEDIVVVERAIADEGRRAARELYGTAVTELDRRAVEESGAARQRLEDRWLATLVGRVRLRRYRVRGRERSFHPLDRALGLGPGEPSPALRLALRDLATMLSHRDAARALAWITGERLSAQAVSRALGEQSVTPRRHSPS